MRGNATAIEWLRSPIVYQGDGRFRDGLLAMAASVVERGSIGRHYLHVALRQRAGSPSLKRFFYVLRPAAALRWLEVHAEASVPPMDLPTLLAEGEVPDDVLAAADDLIALKARTRELGAGSPHAVLQRFVADQLARGQRFETMPPARDPAVARRIADDYFRAQVV